MISISSWNLAKKGKAAEGMGTVVLLVSFVSVCYPSVRTDPAKGMEDYCWEVSFFSPGLHDDRFWHVGYGSLILICRISYSIPNQLYLLTCRNDKVLVVSSTSGYVCDFHYLNILVIRPNHTFRYIARSRLISRDVTKDATKRASRSKRPSIHLNHHQLRLIHQQQTDQPPRVLKLVPPVAVVLLLDPQPVGVVET